VGVIIIPKDRATSLRERERWGTDALEMKLWVLVEKKVLLVDEVVEVSLEREKLREDL